MRTTTPILTALVLFGSGTGVAIAQEPVLVMTADLEKSEFFEGEPIHVLFTLRNTGGDTV